MRTQVLVARRILNDLPMENVCFLVPVCACHGHSTVTCDSLCACMEYQRQTDRQTDLPVCLWYSPQYISAGRIKFQRLRMHACMRVFHDIHLPCTGVRTQRRICTWANVPPTRKNRSRIDLACTWQPQYRLFRVCLHTS
jgi:hypothetical protein